ncbi:hypothetical protein AAHC03_09390 [Spirometra sp. Aus1]
MERAYWQCPKSAPPKDSLHVISAVVNCLSLVLNFGLLIVLFLLTGKARLFLVHLRALTASAAFYSFIEICNRLIPYQNFPTDPNLGAILCYVWMSNYLSLTSYTFGTLILNFIVGNRAIQIACKYQYSFSTSLVADLAYLGGMGLVSLAFVLPQAFILHWDGKYCRCRDTNLVHGHLVSLYAEIFVRFGLVVILSTIILSISCYKIIYWVRNTPAEQLSDTWNSFAFASTTREQMEAFSRPQGWMTASICTLPLSANFIVVSILEAGHEFVCAVGLCTSMPYSPFARVAHFLIDLQLFLLPIIITIYIPALRDLLARVCHRLFSPCIRQFKTVLPNSWTPAIFKR